MGLLKWSAIGLGAVAIGLGASVAIGVYLTERDIQAFRAQVVDIARQNVRPIEPQPDLSTLPAPVQRYFAFTFPEGLQQASMVKLKAEGQFRRPLTETFNFTTSEQVIAIGEPALMFSATTPIVPGIWARAYDYFAEGEMEMKAKIVSLLTVVDEKETPELNVISLRRWLLESALFPHALLPGGAVRWEPIDDDSARAVVRSSGLDAELVAHFASDGRMTRMVAEEDGDLTTPYHGSGEHVTRDDYRLVDGVMIPHRFVISRYAGGQTYPFFDASLTSIAFK